MSLLKKTKKILTRPNLEDTNRKINMDTNLLFVLMEEHKEENKCISTSVYFPKSIKRDNLNGL